MTTPLLRIENLSLEYYRNKKVLPAVRNVSFDLTAGETLAVVGESGSGKSSLALAVMGLISPADGKITAGKILFKDRDLLTLNREQWRALRGKDIAVVFQDPFSSLNPVMTVGDQIAECITAHFPGTPATEVRNRVKAALDEVLFSDPARIAASYPHQLSGGQRQRIALAMAIVNRPQILIADEPTTALDVTIQKEILDLIDRLKKELSLTVLLITHDLALACRRSQEIAVMYAGEIVEKGPGELIFFAPAHPYTQGLISSVPRRGGKISPFALSGQPPDLTRLPPGCAFNPRCASRLEHCTALRPEACIINGVNVRCFLYDEKRKTP
jgi:oligopeptide/dipeptide ABC transporter ATP-binding protein